MKESNSNRISHLCLHPTSDELLQFTNLTSSSPFSDKLHKHSNQSKVVIPMHGLAPLSTFDLEGGGLRSQAPEGTNPVANSTQVSSCYTFEVLSDSFVMIEIGTGTLISTSTVYR